MPDSQLEIDLINNSFKKLLNNNLNAGNQFKEILPKNIKIVQHLFNNVNYFYNSFLGSQVGILKSMKTLKTQNTNRTIKSMNMIYHSIIENIEVISKIRRSLKFIYMEIGKKL